MSRYSEEKPVRKVLPYSISEIGGADKIKNWRTDQLISYEEFKRKRQAKFDAIKNLPIGTIDKYENPMMKAFNRTYPEQIVHKAVSDGIVEWKKESYFKQLTNKALDWFLSLQF